MYPDSSGVKKECMNLPSLEDMLKAGMHFGHKTSRWHPNMKPFIFTERGGVHVINLELTREYLEKALDAARQMAAEGKVILFVGTKKQARDIVKYYAEQCGMPYITERWLGGLLTNFSEINKLVRTMLSLKEQKAQGSFEKYTKKEQMEVDEKIAQLEHMVGGMASVSRLPDALFVIDMRLEKTALTEAKRKHVTVFGLCDTNANPERATYVIPGNDDAINSITMVVSLMAAAISEGKSEFQQKQAAAPVLTAVRKVVHEVETKEKSE